MPALVQVGAVRPSDADRAEAAVQVAAGQIAAAADTVTDFATEMKSNVSALLPDEDTFLAQLQMRAKVRIVRCTMIQKLTAIICPRRSAILIPSKWKVPIR